MVQNLLRDRFKFSAHWETRVGDVYNLVVAKGGHKMPALADGDDSRGLYETRNGRLPATKWRASSHLINQRLPGIAVPILHLLH
jgi:uncharacterized protein (TIGR03435 family)